MSYGPIKVFTVGYSGGVSFSSAFTIPQAIMRGYLEIPSMSTGSDLFLQGSSDGVTYRRIMQEVPQTSTAQINTFTVASAVVNGAMVPLQMVFPYMKVEPSTAFSGATNFKLICQI